MHPVVFIILERSNPGMFGRSKNVVKNLTDLHSHILFGVDDGAKTIEDSIKMLKMASEDGINTFVLTPHCHPRRGNSSFELIKDNFKKLKELALSEVPGVSLFLGREVYYSSDINENPEYLSDKCMLSSNSVLIEFSFGDDENKIRNGVHSVIMAGYHPIVAHVERYQATVDDYTFVAKLKELGADIQINADSVLGGNGSDVKRCVSRLLKEGLVDYIATDAHDLSKRKPVLSECYTFVKKKYGEAYADKLLRFKPEKIF